MNSGTAEQLRKVIALNDVSDDTIKWILDHSEYYEFNDGDVLSETGKPIDHLWFICEGCGKFYLDINGKLVYYYSFENNVETGGAGGLIPYSRMVKSPGFTYAEGIVKVFKIHRDCFRELESRDPALVQKLIGYMTERVRRFATLKLQHEKVSALGQIAAGIAHELNNPASVILRISSELIKILDRNYELTENLLAGNINPNVITALKVIAGNKNNNSIPKLSLSQRLHLEDEISDWMMENGVKEFGNSTVTFAESGITKEDLEKLKSISVRESFQTILEWFENFLTTQKILSDLGNSTAKISSLVDAMKSHVRMDRTDEKQDADLHKDIENSLTLLGYKISEKNITVIRNYQKDLPLVCVYASELNQVWTNLIDNAVFALNKKGILTIDTSYYNKTVQVKISDNGSGIPEEIVSRIYDPFFTTKKAGEGTGIGLDLVLRIIKKHDGEIKVKSVPGKTEFTVCLPA